jgi:hypothetical protein
METLSIKVKISYQGRGSPAAGGSLLPSSDWLLAQLLLMTRRPADYQIGTPGAARPLFQL